MDRREFFRTIISSAFLPPLFATSRSPSSSSELYLISDSPHLVLPLLLEDLQKFRLYSGRNFFLRNFHPQAEKIHKSLSQKAWLPVQEETLADVFISSSRLRQAASPSFTLIKEGRVLDIRSEMLLGLWKEINQKGKVSASLTIASFKKARLPQAGTKASIYIEGRKKHALSLKHDFSKTFLTREGQVTVAIEKGKVFVQDSSCPNKICLFSSPASLVGERIICAPNHFLLEIEGPRFIDTAIG